MKIKDLKTFVANVSRTNFVFVKLYTDAGIEGVGEATLEWKTLAIVSALEELKRVLVGEDPFETDRLVETMHRDSYWRTGALFRTALGAVEAALLDIKGKALGVPVYELLGGKFRDRIACYANHWFFGAQTPDEYAANARKAVAMGYRALKWDPFEAADLEMTPQQRRRTIDIVAAVLSLALIRLEDESAGAAPAAHLAERFVADMDGQLREIGIGDIVVGKHVGRMMGMLGGRLGAYREALAEGGDLTGPIERNIYRGDPPGDAAVTHVRNALVALHGALAATPIDRLVAGDLP